MARHMFVTALIVVLAYVGLLSVIGHPFVAEAKSELMANKNEVTEAVQGNSKERNPASAEQATIIDIQKPRFKGPSIVGVTSVVNLVNAEQEINQVWQRLFSNTALLSNVNWSKGNLNAYVYYQNFTADMSQAQLTVGFSEGDLIVDSSIASVRLPTGQYEQFFVDPRTGVVNDEAWLKAYTHKNLVERHILNRNGESVSTDAIVVIE
jgi:predicted transcriptional regulator YdeE